MSLQLNMNLYNDRNLLSCYLLTPQIIVDEKWRSINYLQNNKTHSECGSGRTDVNKKKHLLHEHALNFLIKIMSILLFIQ